MNEILIKIIGLKKNYFTEDKSERIPVLRGIDMEVKKVIDIRY